MTTSPAPTASTSLNTSEYVRVGGLGLLAGSLAVNALPHLTQGLGGNDFQTPFGTDSSPAVNLAWGSANLLLALTSTYLVRRWARTTVFLIGAAAGAVGTGASLLVLLR